eukprot:s2164_g6.t1
MQAYADKFGKSKEEVKQMGDWMKGKFDAVGLPYAFTEKGLVSSTFDAHRVLTEAYRQGGAAAQDKAAEALFHSYFAEEKAPNDPEELKKAALAAGLDGDKLVADKSVAAAEVKEEPSHSPCKAKRLQSCSLQELKVGQQLRVRGVPHFVIRADGSSKAQQISGAQPPEEFVHAFRAASAHRHVCSRVVSFLGDLDSHFGNSLPWRNAFQCSEAATAVSEELRSEGEAVDLPDPGTCRTSAVVPEEMQAVISDVERIFPAGLQVKEPEPHLSPSLSPTLVPSSVSNTSCSPSENSSVVSCVCELLCKAWVECLLSVRPLVDSERLANPASFLDLEIEPGSEVFFSKRDASTFIDAAVSSGEGFHDLLPFVKSFYESCDVIASGSTFLIRASSWPEIAKGPQGEIEASCLVVQGVGGHIDVSDASDLQPPTSRLVIIGRVSDWGLRKELQDGFLALGAASAKQGPGSRAFQPPDR